MKKKTARRKKEVDTMTVVIVLTVSLFSAVIGYMFGVSAIAGKF